MAEVETDCDALLSCVNYFFGCSCLSYWIVLCKPKIGNVQMNNEKPFKYHSLDISVRMALYYSGG